MWNRLRSRTMAPRRPAVWPWQWPLAILTALCVLGGLAVVVWWLWN